MKICYISDLYHPYAIGGAEVYLQRLVDEISKHADVSVITTVPPDCSIPEVTKEKNVTFYRFVPKPLDSILNFSRKSFASRHLWQAWNLWNLYSYKKIKKYLDIEKPEIVHTHNFKGLSPSVFSAIRDGKFLHVHTVHDYNLISPWSNLMRSEELIERFNAFDSAYIRYMRYMTRLVNTVIFPSTFAKKMHISLGFFQHSYFKVLHNGLPLNTSVSQKNFQTINVLYVGTLSFYKGLHVLLKAFQSCSNQNLRLHIVGEGYDRAFMERLTRNDKRIIFHGRVPEPVLEKIYQESNFFVIPSLWYEVLPMVIQEAMAYGLPVVGSAIGGILDLVVDGYNGFLFKPGDHNSLAQIIQKLSMSPEDLANLSANSLQFIRKFDISTHAGSLVSLYRTIMN